MLILDTNVLSALMKDAPDPLVVSWLNHQPASSVWITVITVYEIRYGLAVLSNGKRKNKLQELFEMILREGFERRVLPLDTDASECAAAIAAKRHKTGKIKDDRDTLIAGIATVRRAKIVTRNERHFDDLDIKIINPWKSK